MQHGDKQGPEAYLDQHEKKLGDILQDAMAIAQSDALLEVVLCKEWLS